MTRSRFWSVMLLLIGFGLAPQFGSAQESLPTSKETIVVSTSHSGAPIAGALGSSMVGSGGSGGACSGPGCNAGCNTGCNTCESPTRDWMVRLDVGVVYMRRDRPNNPALIAGPTGATILSEDNFDFDWEYGIDAKLIADRCDGRGFELRYFWLNDFNASATATVPAGSTLLTNPVTPILAPATTTAIYRSEIQSAEANLRRGGEKVTFVTGFRWINLDESLTTSTPFTFATVGDAWRTENNLYGWQIGADARLLSGCKVRVDGFVRAGLYLNDMDASFSRVSTPAVFTGFANDSTNQLAFAGETGVFATWDITRNISLRGGYQLLYLSGVALAGEQVSTTGNILTANPGLAINRGDVFYHGAKAGLEIRW